MKLPLLVVQRQLGPYLVRRTVNLSMTFRFSVIKEPAGQPHGSRILKILLALPYAI